MPTHWDGLSIDTPKSCSARMRHDEAGKAARAAWNSGAGLHDSLGEVEHLQASHYHAGIALTDLGEVIHFLLAGRDEYRRATAVRDVAVGGLTGLWLGDWDSRTIEPQALRCNWNNGSQEAELVKDHNLGLLQTMQWKVGVCRSPEHMLRADHSSQTFEEEGLALATSDACKRDNR